MKPYKNTSGKSGVISYEIGDDYVTVEFDDGIYLYNYEKPGKAHVAQMKMLALKGTGLATYINKRVRGNYARKLS